MYAMSNENVFHYLGLTPVMHAFKNIPCLG